MRSLVQAMTSCVSVFFLGVWLAAPSKAVTPARILALGNVPGTIGGGAYALSADGRWIGGWVRDPDTWLQLAAGWHVTPNGVEIIPIGDLDGGRSFSTVQGVTANGAVMVGSGEVAEGQEALRWTRETGIQGLGELPGGEFGSYANAVSDDGRVIAGYSQGANGLEAVIWTDAGIRGLGFLPGGFFSEATAITPDGRTVVGTSGSATGIGAFRWTEETGMVGVGPTSWGLDLHTLAVSDDGRVLAGWAGAAEGDTAWMWNERDGLQLLGDLPGGDFHSWVWDLNHDGSVVLGYGRTDDGDTAFIWDRMHGMRSLQDVLEHDYGMSLAGWHLMGAEGITTDARTITGVAKTPSGSIEGFLVTLPSACDDGLDNDGDGLVDFGDDPGCPTPESGPENPACDDGIDDDGDGLVDFADPACSAASPYRESPAACGFGAELALLMPALAWLRDRRGIAARARYA